MATYQNLLSGLEELGIHKMQEYLDTYVNLVNNGEKSFTQALEELVEIEKKENQKRRDLANVKVANFPFLKTFDDYEFDFQPNINKKGKCSITCTLIFKRSFFTTFFLCSLADWVTMEEGLLEMNGLYLPCVLVSPSADIQNTRMVLSYWPLLSLQCYR